MHVVDAPTRVGPSEVRAPVSVPRGKVQALAFVLHELATNAVKYGALSVEVNGALIDQILATNVRGPFAAVRALQRLLQAWPLRWPPWPRGHERLALRLRGAQRSRSRR